jgi:F-type H+-transporting ATPase subunit b
MIRLIRPWFFFLTVAFFIGLSAMPAAAADRGWRPVYDVVMLWINFGILVFLILKLLRRPLANFFQERRDEMALELRRIEGDKERAVARVNEAREEMAQSMARLEAVREKIVQEGVLAKEEMIQDAQEHSRVLIEEARRRIDNHLYLAKQQFKEELIDLAMDLALARLPREVSDQDHQRYIERYLKAAG